MVNVIYKRKLNESEEKTIEHFRYYFDLEAKRGCFALLSESVVMILPEEDSGEPERLEQDALEGIAQALSCHPDFSAYVMDDNFGIISMAGGVYGVTSAVVSEEEVRSGELSFPTALALRTLCLEACERGEVIAIVDSQL